MRLSDDHYGYLDALRGEAGRVWQVYAWSGTIVIAGLLAWAFITV